MNGTTSAAAMLLCDNCWGLAMSPSTHNPMFPEAECEGFCNLDLDHEGLCAERPSKRPQQMTCTNCGDSDRLHEVDPADVDDEGREALAVARRESIDAGVIDAGPYAHLPCIWGIGGPHEHPAGEGYHLVRAGEGGVCCDTHWDERLR